MKKASVEFHMRKEDEQGVRLLKEFSMLEILTMLPTNDARLTPLNQIIEWGKKYKLTIEEIE